MTIIAGVSPHRKIVPPASGRSKDANRCERTVAARGPLTKAGTVAPSDEALLRAIAKGDRDAMRTLFTRHRVRVFRFALRIIGSRALAEDVLSDVFLDIWRKADRFEGRSTASTWILAVARHKALTSLRGTRMARLDDDLVRAIPDASLDPESELAAHERAAALRHALLALTPEHREIIDLVYYQEKSIGEVAEILAIPLNTVKTRMFYARRRLADLAAGHRIDADRPRPASSSTSRTKH